MSNELAPVNPGQPQSAVALFDPTAVDFWSSLDPKQKEHQLLIFTAREGQSVNVGDQIGKTIRIQHMLIHACTWTAKDGEVIDGTRVVLIDPNGTCYGSVSEGILRSVKLIGQVFGPPPYQPPFECEVIQVKLRNGNNMLSLRPNIEGRKKGK